MSSIFNRIIAGEIPSYKIAEDEDFLAFLDANPNKPGHTLVVPKKEVNNLWDNPAEMLSRVLVFAQPIAKAIEQAFPCNRCGLSVVGIEVPHTHLHLIPISTSRDLWLGGEKAANQMSLEEAQQKILDALATQLDPR